VISKIIKMNLKEEINRIKKLIESTSDEEKQSPTEQTLIDLLLKNNFIKLTSQKQADEILKIKKKIDLSLVEWAYVKAQEGLICTKHKKTNTIYFSRKTIKVNNRKYWEPYSISENTPEKKLEESTDVAMTTYSFNFPLNSEDLRKYNLAIKYYITNLIPKKELEKMEKSDLKYYIEKIK